MTRQMSLEELGRFTGEPESRLRQWRSLGLIGEGKDGFRREDVGRVRLFHDLLHRGLNIDAVAKMVNDPESALCRYLIAMSPRWSQPIYSLDEVAHLAGIDAELVGRLADAGGLRQPGDSVTEEDVGFFRACKIALDSGYPEGALLQLLRVYADAMERVAEAADRITRFFLHDRLRADGLSGRELHEAVDEKVRGVDQMTEPAILYFHRKGMARAIWEDVLTRLQEDAGAGEKTEAPGQMRRCVMFVDLANFTPLAEAMGDIRAAEVLDRFAEIVRSSNVRCHGRIVKQIGDAFMVVFPESVSAVSCAVEIQDRAARERQFPPVRAGLHWGSVLYREGDYVGSDVNLASRLASNAAQHEILVTSEVHRRSKSLPGVEFARLGKRRFKGLRREVEVFRVQHRSHEATHTETDPVCGMELDHAEAAAHLTLDGTERAFCSDECLRKFVEEPGKYSV